MQMKTLGLTLMMLSAALAGCTTGDETGTTDMDLLEAKINDLENSQSDLEINNAEQEQTYEDLLASISLIESANMQAIQSLESDYQQSLADLESSYIIAIESLILANNQTLDEINETNAAAFDDLLLSLNSLQTNLQNSQYSIDQISLIVDDLDEDEDIVIM